MISLPYFDWLVLAPEVTIVVAALLVLAVDLALPRGRKAGLPWLALAGVLASAAVTCFTWTRPGSSLQGMLVADGYALFFQLAILVAAALAVLYSADYVDRIGLPQGEYYTLLLISAAGMLLMAAAANLITLFVSLEMLSIALYILVGMNRAEARSSEAAMKYLVLGAVASGFLLYGMALLFGQAGTTSLSGIAGHVASLGRPFPPLLGVGLGMMVVGLGFKVALVPFQMWVPDVYQGAPTPVTAFMSVGAKAAALAALGRLILDALGGLVAEWQPLLAALACLSLIVGTLSALRQTNLKRMLAFSGVAHAGTIVIGLLSGKELGAAGTLFYLFVYALMNTAAFAVIIAVERLEGPQGQTLDGMAGLASRHPALAVMMALALLSLSGFPPLAGFWAKLHVFSAAVQAGYTWLVVVAVLASAVALAFYLRVVAAMLLRAPLQDGGERGPICPALVAGLGLSCASLVLLGVWPAPLLNLARAAVTALFGG